MYKLPVVIKPHENEMGYSYLLRIKKANEIDSLQKFISLYLHKEKDKQRKTFSMYTFKYICDFDKSLDIGDIEYFDLFKNHSFYPFLSLFLTPQMQIQYLNVRFRKYANNSRLINDTLPYEIEHVMLCPKCRQEDISKHGHFYLHKEHQLPDVKVCAKHKVPLQRYVGKYGEELKLDSEWENVVIETDFEAEFDYAEFVKDLHEADLDTNIDEIINIISNKLQELDMTFDEFNEAMKKSKLSSLYTFPQSYDFKFNDFGSSKRNYTVDEKNIVIILKELFGSVSNIPFQKKEPSKKWLKTLEKEGYELVSPYKNNLLMLRHKKCRNCYITSADAFNRGWQCPICDLNKSDTEIVNRIINFVGNHEYELAEKFVIWNKSIYIRHLTCGNLYKSVPRQFIEGIGKCCCTPPERFEDVDEYVGKKNNFELIKYNKKNGKCKIKCKYCNQTFIVTIKDFWKKKQCPHCKFTTNNRKGKPKTKKTDFLHILKELTGDEYKLIGEFSTTKKITLLHTTCNEKFETTYSKFVKGDRCKKCEENLSFEEFRSLVMNLSNGRYECSKHSSKSISVLDTYTNTTQIMSRKMILQELRRPTPSKLLPI